MAKYKVLQRFKNLETNEVYEKGNEVELTVKRADEAIANLKKWDGSFLERINNVEKEVVNKEPEETEEGE